jgi:hypothetical protein
MRKKKFPILLSIVAVQLYWFNFNGDAYSRRTINSIKEILYDMNPPHESSPHGVPATYNWASGPRISMGNYPKDFKAMIAWGQLYEAATGNPATSTRVQIRNIKAYMLSKQDGKWHLLQSSKRVEGGAYREDFAGDVSRPADIRSEADGSVSVKAGQGYNFHFWPTTGRVPIEPDDVGGIFTTVQARLIIGNSHEKDDRSEARYLLSMGGDYWLDLTAKWDNFTTNADIGIGKFKYVTTEWQAFNMITLSSAQIYQNPPPLE